MTCKKKIAKHGTEKNEEVGKYESGENSYVDLAEALGQTARCRDLYAFIVR